MREWIVPFLLAMGTGVLSAWGVGGGTLLLVAMTLLLGVEQRLAQTVNLLFFLPAAAVSLWLHGRGGYLDRPTWRTALLPGVLAAFAGAWAALWLDAALLRRPFGIFLVCCALAMLLRRRRE